MQMLKNCRLIMLEVHVSCLQLVDGNNLVSVLFFLCHSFITVHILEMFKITCLLRFCENVNFGLAVAYST